MTTRIYATTARDAAVNWASRYIKAAEIAIQEKRFDIANKCYKKITHYDSIARKF